MMNQASHTKANLSRQGGRDILCVMCRMSIKEKLIQD